MISKYHPAYLTDCLWSSRCGLYFISRTDGWINAYDLCYKINESTFTYKVCDSALTSICITTKGDKLIIGDEEGKIYLLKLSKSFYSQADIENKKEYINKLFERELAREKYIESLGKKKGPVKDDSAKIAKQEQMIKERIKKIDEEYTNFLTGMLNKSSIPRE
jgi:dynein intermediate chain 2